MKRSAVIVAGGKGARMESSLPKQFLLLLDIPILMHTIERFAMAFEDISLVVVLPADQRPLWDNLCRQMDFDIPHTVVDGGATRYESVRNGLEACPSEGIVGIHDGVRPLVTTAMIERCYGAAEEYGSALPVMPVTQSLRRVVDGKNEVVSRDGMVEVQTPQCFDISKLKPCYQAPADPSFTDDATVFELAGHSIHLVDGEATNIKITTQGDLAVAEALIAPPKQKGKKGKR